MSDDDFFCAMVDAYLECALWSSTDESDESGGIPLDREFSRGDIHADAIAEAERECGDFFTANRDDVVTLDPESVGHDFWLTRNGHGAGFWDRGYGERGDRLSDAAKVYGEVNLYVGDDGQIHAA